MALAGPLAVYTRMIGAEAAAARSRATVVCAHATGFCAAVFRPFAAALEQHAARADVRVKLVALDFSGHGASRERAVGTNARAWGHWCPADVVSAIGAADAVNHPSTPRYGVGHSMGGAALLMAMLQHDKPDVARKLFTRAVVFEPIVFPVANMSSSDGANDSPLAAGAARRKHTWPSVDAARAYAVSKPLFASWHADALDGYMDDALVSSSTPTQQHLSRLDPFQRPTHRLKDFLMPPQRSTAHVGSVTLACAPAFEADIYRGWHDTYDHLGSIQTPIHVVAGETSTHMARFGPALKVFKDVADRLPHGSFEILPRVGHFCVMEAPVECAAAAARAFGWTQ